MDSVHDPYFNMAIDEVMLSNSVLLSGQVLVRIYRWDRPSVSFGSAQICPQELADKVHVIGNAALDGAAILLMDTSARQQLSTMRSIAKHVRLDGNPEFSQRYIEAMLFPE